MTEPLTPAAGSRIMPDKSLWDLTDEFGAMVARGQPPKPVARPGYVEEQPRMLSQHTIDHCRTVMARDAARDAEAQLTDPERIGTGVML